MISTIWAEFLKIIKDEAGSRVVDTWFNAVTLKNWNPLELTVDLEVPNVFVKDWLTLNYIKLIQTNLERLFNRSPLHITFTTRSDIIHDQVIPQVMSVATPVSVTVPVASIKNHAVPCASERTYSSGLKNNYRFNTFIVGPNNTLAYAAAHAVVDKPGILYNPLFLYGSSGLGKTHLLHAIGHEVCQKNSKAAVLYQSADRFVNEFINAIRFDKIHRFQEKYKAVDVLLIDDIQFISGKDQTQEAFFHIFNILYEAQKQIVFTSDTEPTKLHGFAARLRSRLACGLVADISTPTFETKIAIVKKKAELSEIVIEDQVARYVASLDIDNIRELEGALIRLVASASISGQPITLDFAYTMFEKDNVRPQTSPDFDYIVKCVSHYYPYTFDQLRSKGRNKDLATARHIVMFLIKKLTNKSLREIGIYLGDRDHSTVMHAIEKIENTVRVDSLLAVKIANIEQAIIAQKIG